MTTHTCPHCGRDPSRVPYQIFQGHEWADPYGYGYADPEGAWADLEWEGWYWQELDDDGHAPGDPEGPFNTEAEAKRAALEGTE